MKKLLRTKTIAYRWWRNDKKEIKPEHVVALEESAEARIAEMTPKGYTSGELLDNVYMSQDDPEDGVDYTGWWWIADK